MAKHKYIKTPDEMLDLFEAYVEETRKNPRTIEKATNKGIQTESMRVPLTMAGFEVFCYKAVGTIEHYFRNSEDSYNEYRGICSHIKKVIRRDQIEGGMVGQYNPSITQRLNSLTEKQDITTDGDKVTSINVTYIDGHQGDEST